MTIALADAFTDNVRDAALWNLDSLEVGSGHGGSGGATGSTNVTVSETNTRLEITPPTSNPGGTEYRGYVSVNTFNLTDEDIYVQVTGVTSTTGVSDTELEFGPNSANHIRFIKEDTTLYMQRIIAGSATTVGTLTYSGATHAWWRLRHTTAGDQFLYDTSTDGTAWTNRGTVARSTLTITASLICMEAGTFGSDAAPGTALFDNFDTAPAGGASPFTEQLGGTQHAAVISMMR